MTLFSPGIQPTTLLTQAELLRKAGFPAHTRFNLHPDYSAGMGHLKLFREDRVPELIAARKARLARHSDEHDPFIHGPQGNSAKGATK